MLLDFTLNLGRLIIVLQVRKININDCRMQRIMRVKDIVEIKSSKININDCRMQRVMRVKDNLICPSQNGF